MTQYDREQPRRLSNTNVGDQQWGAVCDQNTKITITSIMNY